MVESRLLRELKQSRPFASQATEALLSILKTADMVRSRTAAIFKERGLTVQQYNVLRILRGALPEGLPTLEIADRMVEKAPGITRLLDRLESKGWVRRQRCPEDRRQVLCWATPTALELLAELDGPVNADEVATMAGLDAAEQAQLIELLGRLRASL
ncbi:MAG: MarR family transcriptional regulator [Acidobacteriota bacterium]